MSNTLEPALDSCAGNIEIALYMANEIESELESLCRRRHDQRRTAVLRQQPGTREQGISGHRRR